MTVCLLFVTIVSPAKMAKPIEMPFGCDIGGPRNHKVGGSPNHPQKWQVFLGMMS